MMKSGIVLHTEYYTEYKISQANFKKTVLPPTCVCHVTALIGSATLIFDLLTSK